jgi:hypothetical protein
MLARVSDGRAKTDSISCSGGFTQPYVGTRQPTLGNFDNNFWGTGVDPSPSAVGYFSSGFYPLTTPVFRTAETAWSGSLSCTGGYTFIRTDQDHPTSTSVVTSSTCAELKSWTAIDPGSAEEAEIQYDTVRLYIEQCAASDDQSYRAFRSLSLAVGLMTPADTNRYNKFREWLISVIFLNRSSDYFCACIGAISGTYLHYAGYPSEICYLSVLNYIRHNSACAGAANDKEFTRDSIYAWQHGMDPAHLPSLDSLGLGFLNDPNLSASPSTATIGTDVIASIQSSPNPFVGETSLRYELNRRTYVTASVYDALGRMVWGDGKGRSLDAGSHTIRIDGSTLPSGTLYARISTGFGEVKTVKLVHE